MPDTTPNLDLPFIMPAQAQKHVTHNEAIELLDMVVQLTLEQIEATVPPGTPSEGQAWALGSGTTGAWAGQGGAIATWRGGGWLFVTPREGWTAWVKASGTLQVNDGGAWVPLAAAGGHGAVGDLLQLTPRATAPGSPAAGDVYFDSATARLRCFDGTVWQDLF